MPCALSASATETDQVENSKEQQERPTVLNLNRGTKHADMSDLPAA
jgi:hypothetical protein